MTVPVNKPNTVKMQPFADPSGYRARFKGIQGTALAGQVSNIDHTLAAERWIDGVELFQEGAAQGDFVDFQVVHPQAGVLDQFGESWVIDHAICKQGAVVLSYPAKVPAGLTIRIRYTSTGGSNVWVGANLRLHMKT